MQARTLRLRHCIGYGMGDIFGGGAFVFIGMYLIYYLTVCAGMTHFQAGLITMIGASLGAVIDPIIGYVSDNMRTSLGRRRFFFVYATPLIPIFSLIWISAMSFYYYLFIYCSYFIVFTVISVAYDTLIAEMTDSYKDRTKMTSARMFFSQIGGALCLWIVHAVIHKYPESSEQHAFFITGCILCVIYTIPWIFVFRSTWERQPSQYQPQRQTSFVGMWKDLFSNIKTAAQLNIFRWYIAIYIGAYSAMDICNASLVFYLIYYALLSQNTATEMQSVLLFAQVFSIPLISWFSMKVDSVTAFRYIAASLIGMMFVFSLLSVSTSIFIFYGAFILFGLLRGCAYFIPYNIFNFIPDVDELITGQRREGIYAGTMVFVRKLSQGIVMFVVSLLIGLSGITPGAQAAPQTVNFHVMYVFTLGTAILLLFGLIYSLKFKINQQRHEVLSKAITQARTGKLDLSTFTANEISMLERLSGRPSNQFFPGILAV